MKGQKRSFIKVFGSRKKWSRRGRNLADFLMSFSLAVLVSIFKIIFAGSRFIVTLLFFSAIKVFSRKRTNLAVKNDKAASTILPDRFARLRVLMDELEGKAIKDNLDISNVIDMTTGCSRAQLAKIVENAEKMSLIRGGHMGSSIIMEQDLIAAARKINSVI
jgi:uncharacterized membrane protein